MELVTHGWLVNTKPAYKSENGAAFQLTESYMGGLSNVTTINRTISRNHSSNAVNLSKIALLILLSPTSVLANA